MKRDWETIRQILLRLEEAETPNTTISMDSFSGIDEQQVGYNMRLLSDADCIEAKILNSSTGDGKIAAAFAKRLTPQGHDLLDSMKNDTVWSKVKDTFESKGIDMTVDLVIQAGKKIIENMLFS